MSEHSLPEKKIRVIKFGTIPGAGVTPKAVGLFWIFIIAPVAQKIIFVFPRPDVSEDRGNNLVVLRVARTNGDGRLVSLTIGISKKSDIPRNNGSYTCLKGISYKGNDGYPWPR